MEVLRKLVHLIYEVIEAFVVSASVFVVVHLFLMQPHQVKGSSMYPTYKDGQYLLTDKVTYKTRQPKWGDIIVFKAPINESYDFIKRVIATAGETVMISGGNVYVNGERIDESTYLSSDVRTSSGQFLKEGVSYTVPDGSVIALGDNRDHSSDSRDWGPVPDQNIVGKVFFRYWPTDGAGLIKDPF